MAIEHVVADVRDWMPEIRAALRVSWKRGWPNSSKPLDPGRLEQELRAAGHAHRRRRRTRSADGAHQPKRAAYCRCRKPVGRRLDFLMQEFNREANTLGSKSVDTRSTNAAIELKVLIEQMREQVQNIE